MKIPEITLWGILMLLTLASNACAQEEGRSHSLWGKLALSQNFPNPVVCGEMTSIRYKAHDVQDVLIILYDENGKVVFTFDDLFPGNGQIRIRKRLEPGRYKYALYANGRMVEKKLLEVIEDVTTSAEYPLFKTTSTD
jgi:hypothetical protein